MFPWVFARQALRPPSKPAPAVPAPSLGGALFVAGSVGLRPGGRLLLASSAVLLSYIWHYMQLCGTDDITFVRYFNEIAAAVNAAVC